VENVTAVENMLGEAKAPSANNCKKSSMKLTYGLLSKRKHAAQI
jgi:hypothetical protein